MSDHKEALKSMLQDIIHDRTEQAEVTLHNYIVAKTRDVSGLGVDYTPNYAASGAEVHDDNFDDDNNEE